jgi:23S rRNA pseudouridine2605 synthase
VVDLVASERRLIRWGVWTSCEGLILVSNDGELTNRVTHPSYGVTKTYLARVAGRMASSTIRRLSEGVDLEDGPARALKVRLVDTRDQESLVELVMGEGRNREVRRMLAAVGHEVTQLVRTAIGPITDPRLRPGDRRLSPEEQRHLLSSADGADGPYHHQAVRRAIRPPVEVLSSGSGHGLASGRSTSMEVWRLTILRRWPLCSRALVR